MIKSTISLVLCVLSLLSAVADDSKKEEPQVVRDLRAKMPAGWNCTVHQGDDVKSVPHGLKRPLFQVVASNTNVSFVKDRERI